MGQLGVLYINFLYRRQMPGSLSEKLDKTTVSLSELPTAVAAAALVHTLNRIPSDARQ